MEKPAAPTTAPREHEEALLRTRAGLGLVAVVFPGWSLMLRLLAPEVDPTLPGRIGCGVLCLALLLASFASTWLRGRLMQVGFFVALVIQAQTAYYLQVNHLNAVAVVEYVLVVFSLAIALDTPAQVFGTVAFAVALTLAIRTDNPVITRGYLAATCTVALPVSYVALRSRLRLIASLKQQNQELALSRAALADTQRAARIGGWSFDVATGAMWWSEQMYALLGIAPGTPVTPESIGERFAPATRATIAEAWRAANGDGREFDLEIAFADPAQGPRSLRLIGRLVTVDGRTSRMFGSIQDVTEQKALHDELREREAYARAIIDAIPGFVVWVKDDLTYRGVNQAVAGFTGIPTDAFPGKPLGTFARGDRQPLADFVRDLFAGGQAVLSREITLDLLMGEREVLVQGAKYDDGREAVIVGLDVTDRKIEERNLNNERELLTQVLDHMPHGIYAKDAAGGNRFIVWNRRMESLFGVPREAVLGRTDHEIFPAREADRLRRLDGFVMADRRPLDVPEEDVQTVTGPVPAHTIRVPVFDAAGKPAILLGVIEDMRETREREELIRSQQMQLMQASKMSTLGEMSGGIAHEINNPLTVIGGFAQRLNMLLEEPEPKVDELRRCAAKIGGMTERIARIVRGLRTFAREASQDPFEVTSVARLFGDTMELSAQRFVANGIELTVAGAVEDLLVECRPVQISQVLLNLLSNAFDAVKPLSDKWVRLEAEDRGDTVHLAVVDSGRGIERAVAQKMLQPFFTTKGVGQGTGLGLSISRGIVETHHGQLSYDAKAPNTRFVVELPKRQKRDVAA